MKFGLRRVGVGAMVACSLVAAAVPAYAGDVSVCVSSREAEAFRMRHLQSRLMVAGLACNQREAYNNFVESFRPPLAVAGSDLIAYFQRSGGGQPALNRHVTELANVAGLYRAEDPQAFCEETWNLFLLLEEAPEELEMVAASHTLADVGFPHLCAAPTYAVPPVDSPAQNMVKTSAPVQ